MTATLLLTAALAAPPEPPPLRLPGENRHTLTRLAEAAELERLGKWADALALYQRLLDEAGDDLVTPSDDGRRFGPARDWIVRRIADRPELREPFARRTEARAAKLFDEAIKSPDPAPLSRLLDEAPLSKLAPAAFDRLGDFAFSRGEFREAERLWSNGGSEDAPLVRAKVLLAQIAQGESDVTDEIRQFRDRHPQARGRLIGRDGLLADALDAAVKIGPPSPRLPRAATTPGVSAARSGQLAVRPSPVWDRPAPPAWWATADKEGVGLFQRPARTAAALTFVPLVHGGRVWVNTGDAILSYDRDSVEGVVAFDRNAAGDPPERGDPADTRHTLTANAGRLFARMAHGRMIVCLQHAGGDRWPVRWVLPAPPGQAFDATPVVGGGHIFTSLTRDEGNRAITAVACYDELEPTAGPLWRQDVTEAPAEGERWQRGELLTLDGPRVIACPHAGAVVALDAATGRRCWAYAYPRRTSRLTADLIPPVRDLVPVVAAGGRLFAAPLDADRVLALDAVTGESLWKLGPAFEAVHLLGVAGARLILTTDGFHRGIAALDVRDGRLVPDWGSLTGERPFGRGMLFEQVAVWPTRTGLKLLRLDGRPVATPAAFDRVAGGHVAFADGTLAVATADRLYVFLNR